MSRRHAAQAPAGAAREMMPGSASGPRRDADDWVSVCEVGDLTPDRGRAARVGEAIVALFALADGSVFAVDERCPFTDAHVMSRGIVGDVDGTPTVASPVYKQRFDLGTGRCLEDDTVAIHTWPIRLQEGWVEVAAP